MPDSQRDGGKELKASRTEYVNREFIVSMSGPGDVAFSALIATILIISREKNSSLL
jgi:hypothetical protein